MVPKMMKCGHASNSTTIDGKYICMICHGINHGADEVDENPPNLTGRQAVCCCCPAIVDSNISLPFFESRPDSIYDSFFCGCQGWN
jgi:hypothetical protein